MLPHLKIEPGDLPDYVLFPGDPGRAERVGEKLNHAKVLGDNREYKTITGEFEGERVGVVSAGVGAPGAAIAYEEAIKGGATTLVRIGTTGSLNRAVVDSGDLVVVQSAVRDEGLSYQHLPPEVPAVADLAVTNKLVEVAEELGYGSGTGMVLTTDAFYPGERKLDRDRLAELGVLAVEMECAALFAISRVRKVRAGAILAVNGDASEDKRLINQAIDREIEVALTAVSRLSGQHSTG